MVKYVKFQRPVDFDTKFTHVKRHLDDINQRLHLVDLTSLDLDTVDSKLEQCAVSRCNSLKSSILPFFLLIHIYCSSSHG